MKFHTFVLNYKISNYDTISSRNLETVLVNHFIKNIINILNSKDESHLCNEVYHWECFLNFY